MAPCPVCSEPAVRRCRCLLGHSWCESGHEWHLCPQHHVVAVGAADHKRSGECSCLDREDGVADAAVYASRPFFGPD